MKKTSILKRFYREDRSILVLQSVERIERAIQYHPEIMDKYLGKGFSKSLIKVIDVIKYLTEEIIEPGEAVYLDFKEMVQSLVNKIFEHIGNHSEEKDIKDAIEMYGSEELIGLKYQFDQINLKMKNISNVLLKTLDDQYLCLSQIKTATERAKKIKEGAQNGS